MNLDLEKLMGRPQVSFSFENERELFRDSVCLVTGGGGSIGSELCRQLIKCAPRKLIVVDIYENGAYDLQQELKIKYGTNIPFIIEIASVRDREKMNALFQRYRPDFLFHAAFHKHVPLMEHNPDEAVKNNVFGSWNLAELSEKWKTPYFILISTDKAVNPVSVMGATKRLSEKIVSYFSCRQNQTVFLTVRFGNVMASNGSVIPLFCRQIEAGGPVTITHPEAERYLMTIPEAAALIMRSVSLAKGGEIFVLDMGNPVQITRLAEELIRSYGLIPQKDIAITFTGLRPGEKVKERLVTEGQTLLPTADRMILSATKDFVEEKNFLSALSQLEKVMTSSSRDTIIEKLKNAVPEFIPQEKSEAIQ